MALISGLARIIVGFGGTGARFVTLPSVISAVCIASNCYLADSLLIV